MELSASSVLTLCPSTKQQIQVFADQIINEVTEGNSNPLSVHLQIIALEKTLEVIKSGIRDHVLTEAEKYGQKSFEFLGNKVEIREVGTKYDFKGCSDPVWNRIQESIAELKEAMKEREMLLKSIHKTTSIVDEETGEIAEIHPCHKTSTTGVVITLK